MTPDTVNLNQEELLEKYEVLPTKTYRVDTVNGRIQGTVDEKEAVFQFISKCLSTEKYANEIYDWYYGAELGKLAGKNYDYVVAEIPRILNEALLVDDRIIEVHSFTFTKTSIDSMKVSMIVDTVYGDVRYNMEVAI